MIPRISRPRLTGSRRQVRQGAPSTSWRPLVSEAADGQGAKPACDGARIGRRETPVFDAYERALDRLAVSQGFAFMRPTARGSRKAVRRRAVRRKAGRWRIGNLCTRHRNSVIPCHPGRRVQCTVNVIRNPVILACSETGDDKLDNCAHAAGMPDYGMRRACAIFAHALFGPR
jgi:hypothetical protein